MRMAILLANGLRTACKYVWYGISSQAVLIHTAQAAEVTVNGEFTSPLTAGAVVQTVLGLIVVVVVIIAGAWLLRRVAQLQTGAQSALRVIASVSLGSRERAVLMQVGDRQLLVGIAPGHVSTLHVLDQVLPTEGNPESGMRFQDRLKQILAQSPVRGTSTRPGNPS